MACFMSVVREVTFELVFVFCLFVCVFGFSEHFVVP